MRYDLHVHTNQSLCSNLKPNFVLEVAKRKGLDGIAVTDHNSIAGALQVSMLNKNSNFEVIVGEEVLTDCGEVLVYYLREEIPGGSLQDVLRNARRQTAIVALAHPTDVFRKHFAFEELKKFVKYIDAVETFNGRTLNPIFNDSAYDLAKANNLASIAGSDAHFVYEIGSAVTIFSGSLRKAISRKKTTTEGSTLLGALGVAHTFFYRNFLRGQR